MLEPTGGLELAEPVVLGVALAQGLQRIATGAHGMDVPNVHKVQLDRLVIRRVLGTFALF